MLKASGDLGILRLSSEIKQVWHTGVIPPYWKKGIILLIYKGKGSPKDCKNYRGISLLSTPGKLFAMVFRFFGAMSSNGCKPPVTAGVS